MTGPGVIHVSALDTFLLGAEAPPVKNNFRVLTRRHSLLVRVTDAEGAEGWGEVDANANPLRRRFLPEWFAVRDGRVRLGDAPGPGFTPSPALLAEFAEAD
jgi:L-alanine-DL-glutamate epimerase-like enolase superfamily enzyme